MDGSSDDSNNPSELVIDPDTGVLTLTNEPTILTTYNIVIDIRTTDGTNHKDVTVTGISIAIVCGAGSTTVMPPSLDTQYQVPNLPSPPSLTGQFTVTNDLCPVTSQTITSGNSAFVLSQGTDS